MVSLLHDESKKMGIELTESQLEKFKIYMDFLLEYNTHTNLTAIKNPDDIVIKHFLDSMALLNYVNIKDGEKIIDIGTGAGFPGVPLKIAKKEIEMSLLDSIGKRIAFLKKLTKKLGLKCDTYNERAEELGHYKKFREKYDMAVSRAVAPLNSLCEYCMPYVKLGGIFVALKGPDFQEELEEAKNSISTLGGELLECYKFELPLNKGSRSIVVIKKVKSTPKEYPRKNSQIFKSPL